MIRFNCWSCDGSLKVGPEYAGREAKCPKCSIRLKVPFTSTRSLAVPLERDPIASAPAVPPPPAPLAVVPVPKPTASAVPCPHCQSPVAMSVDQLNRSTRCPSPRSRF